MRTGNWKPFRWERFVRRQPGGLARQWVACGARRLQLTYQDSMVSGHADNADAVRDVVRACPGVSIQVSGGLRDEETVEICFTAGVDYVILDIKAVATPHFLNDLCLEYPNHILVALDARYGKVAAEGWSKFAHLALLEVGEHVQREGAAGILCRDVTAVADPGAGLDTALSLAHAMTIPVFLAGGLNSWADVARLSEAAPVGLAGALLAAGLTPERFDFVKAQQLAAAAPAAGI